MKTCGTASTILFGIVFFLSSTTVAQTWEWQLPLPQGNSLTSIDWADTSTAMAIAGMGTVLVTHDGGVSWTVKHFVTGDVGLKDVSFVDPNTATCVGPDGVIIRTTNGGSSWGEQSSGVTSSLNGVDFIYVDTGYAVGHYGIILVTTDGGAVWSPQTSGTSAHLVDVSFSDANTGCAVGSGGTILWTDDGGTNWGTRTSGTTQTLLGVCLADADTGMAVGSNETALLTTDGGTTWTPQTFPSRPPGDIFALPDVYMADGQHAWIAGYFQDMMTFDIGYVLRTVDGGASWDRVYSDDGGYNFLNSVSFAGFQKGLAVGDYGTIHRTTDGGANWSKVGGAVLDLTMGGVEFFDADHGVAVSRSDLMGGIGEVYYTTDGGVTWHGVRASDVFGPCRFYDVAYASETVVWAVGLGEEFDSIFATFFRSTDGGVSYDVHAYQLCIPPFCMQEYTPSAISFGDPDRGVAVGNVGIVWTIRGLYVSEVASGTSQHLWDVSMPDSVTAIAVGDSGTILTSADAGTSWTPQLSGVTEHLRGVSFVSPLVGTVVGDGGTILRTGDGGATWIPQASGTTLGLYAVDFFDENNGVAVGGNVAVITTDGGTTWTVELPGVAGGLRDVALVPGRTVAAGGAQAILNRKYSVVGVQQQPPAASRHLRQNRPNPFNPVTTIEYDLPEAAHVELVVYNALGQRVATLVDGPQAAGHRSVRWYGIDDGGSRVASGVYFYRLRAGDVTEVRKMVLVK